MYYEDIEIERGDTLPALALLYGHGLYAGPRIWSDPRNEALRAARGRPERMQPGDRLYMPIPWIIISTSMTYNREGSGVLFEARRSGNRGTRLRWVQTVDRGNQPYGARPYGAPRFVVDPSSPPNSDEPFYHARAWLAAHPDARRRFHDTPSRPPPSLLMGTTEWRALLSIAVVTGKRVTVVDTHYWGFNRKRDGAVSKVLARRAIDLQVQDHLRILRNGFGLGDGPGTMAYFQDLGWTFRAPPPTAPS